MKRRIYVLLVAAVFVWAPLFAMGVMNGHGKWIITKYLYWT